MTELFEKFIAGAWNRLASPPQYQRQSGAGFGRLVRDGTAVNTPVVWPHEKRAEHLAILGKTGTGKSSLLRHLAAQDVRAGRGFIYFDLHGDTTQYLLRLIAAEEIRRRADLSTKLILAEPGDQYFSIGLNVLDQSQGQQGFVQIAEFSTILKQRWGLDHFGARTEEVIRNGLLVLADCGLTLIELAPLLTNAAFRAACLRQTQNAEVREYFENRYDVASEAMQATIREAVLNKLTSFTAAPAFRHILGQRSSMFSLRAALDEGCWIVLDLNKGRLGEQAATLGALFLTKIKNALFSRTRRDLFTIYADEIQNLVEFGSGIETLFSEARKFAISVVSANQFLEQYPAPIRAAILSVATHVLFQLSSSDADKMATALDGGKSLAEILKNLPQRNFVAKIGHHRWLRGVVPDVPNLETNATDLYNRCRARWTKRRTDVEAEIRSRQPARITGEGVLDAWE